MKRNDKYKILILICLSLGVLYSLKGPRSEKLSSKEQAIFSPYNQASISHFNPSVPKNYLKEEDKVTSPISDQTKILCEFKKFGSSIPHQGNVRAFAIKLSRPYSGNMVWIKSPECPKDKFSIIFFSDDGHISKEINCLNTSLTELMRHSGEQADVENVATDSQSVNLALSGPGYFVLECPDNSLLITREGKLKKDNSKHLVNQNGCMLLNQDGKPLVASRIIGEENGCSPEGDCIATYDPGRDDIKGLEYLNSYSFAASSGVLPSQSITKVGAKELRPYFITDSLELLKDPNRGATGINWSARSKVNFEDLDCPN